MIWIILICLFTGLLVWLLTGPVIIFVNTETNRYHLALPGIFKASVVPSTEIFHIRGWIFFIPFKFNPFKMKKGKAGEKSKEKSKRKKKHKGWRNWSGSVQMIRGVIRSFRIRKLELDLDTDDFILNAWLVPAFSMVNGENIRMRVNFEGKASLLLDLRTRLGSLLWIFIRTQYRSMFNL